MGEAQEKTQKAVKNAVKKKEEKDRLEKELGELSYHIRNAQAELDVIMTKARPVQERLKTLNERFFEVCDKIDNVGRTDA